MRAHEAGALHGDIGERGPSWLRTPADVNALVPQLWPANVERAADGAIRVAGVDVRDLAAEFGTPAYIFDEADFRARCREFRDAFAGADVFYAAKAFCARAVIRAVAEEGRNRDVCTGGELAVALAAGMPPERIKLHGNNKSQAELEHALDAGVGCIVVDSFDEIGRLTTLARERGVRPRVMVRVTVGVEAHTPEFIATAHEDQKFSFSLGSGAGFDVAARVVREGVCARVIVRLHVGIDANTHEFIAAASEGQKCGFSLASSAAFVAAARIVREGVLDLVGLHSHIVSQIFYASCFEVSARRVLSRSD